MASRTVTVNAHQKYFFQNSIIIKSVQRRRLAVHIIFGFNFFESHFFALNNAFQNFNFKWKCSRWVKNFNKQIGLRYTDSVLPPYDFYNVEAKFSFDYDLRVLWFSSIQTLERPQCKQRSNHCLLEKCSPECWQKASK